MIIDTHVHLSDKLPYSWYYSQWPATKHFFHTAEQYVNKMDASKPRINKSLIFSFRSLCSESVETMKKENDYIVDSIERYPDRLIGACLIDPSWDNLALAELNRMVKLGIRIVKIKFSSRQIPANSPLAKKIMLEVDNLGILALLHSDWSFWTNPSIIGDLMSNYPDTCVVMQHLGLTQNAEALEVLRNNSNIYADTSAVVYPNNIVRFINEVSSDHLMFGSDTIRFYETTMPQEELDRVFNLDLPKTTIDKILGKNAERLLKKVGGIE